jgi:hypothetical protein
MVHHVGPRTGHARIAEPSKQLRSQERQCLLIASETPASIANKRLKAVRQFGIRTVLGFVGFGRHIGLHEDRPGQSQRDHPEACPIH